MQFCICLHMFWTKTFSCHELAVKFHKVPFFLPAWASVSDKRLALLGTFWILSTVMSCVFCWLQHRLKAIWSCLQALMLEKEAGSMCSVEILFGFIENNINNIENKITCPHWKWCWDQMVSSSLSGIMSWIIVKNIYFCSEFWLVSMLVCMQTLIPVFLI